MHDSSRNQGLAICASAVGLGLLFLGIGLLSGAIGRSRFRWRVLLAFVLGLTFWVGYTIATVRGRARGRRRRRGRRAAQAAPPPGAGRRDAGGAPRA